MGARTEHRSLWRHACAPLKDAAVLSSNAASCPFAKDRHPLQGLRQRTMLCPGAHTARNFSEILCLFIDNHSGKMVF